MYKITEDTADFLLYARKNSQIPGLLKDEFKPFVARNTHTIGFINPLMVDASDSKFLVELSLPDFETPEEMDSIAADPASRSWWIYQRSELPNVSEPFEVDREKIDRYYQGTEKLDVADCALKLPTQEVRDTITKITTLEELFVIFPTLKDCLDPEKEAQHDRHPRF